LSPFLLMPLQASSDVISRFAQVGTMAQSIGPGGGLS